MEKTELDKENQQSYALIALSICIIFGLLGTLLFNGKVWGLNITIFVLSLVSSVLLLRFLMEKPLNYVEYFLIASGLFFAITFVWRASLVLNGLSLLGLLATITLAFSSGTRKKLRRLSVLEVMRDSVVVGKYGFDSYYCLATEDIKWDEVQQRWGNAGKAIFRGLLMTIPLLIIFGLLLASSDARFEKAIHDFLDWGWDAQTAIRYIIIFTICSWISAAILRGSALQRGLTVKWYSTVPTTKIGSIETAIILGMLNILFLSFILVQFTYFFGGEALVHTLDGPSYAEYARRGFFQLVTVAVLVITLLLITHSVYRPTTLFEKNLYLIFAGLMIIMTFIIESSAAYRMYLYTQAYGLTELRFYTSVFMLWLIICLIWFCLTVLRGQRLRFAFGAIITGMIFIGLLHAVNPDERIAEVNLARFEVGEKFESQYITSLSADAIPTILKKLPNLPLQQQCILRQQLKFHIILEHQSETWIAWNWSKNKALLLLSEIVLQC